MFKADLIQQPGKLYPYNALHIYAENDTANISAKDDIPKNCSISYVLQAQNRKQCDTCGSAML